MFLFSSEGIYVSLKDKTFLDWKWPWSDKRPSIQLAPVYAKYADRVFGINMDTAVETFCQNFLVENTICVVISDIDVTSKDRSFWLSLPENARAAFTHDIVFMDCDNLNHALNIAENVPYSLAGTVWIYYQGNLKRWKEHDT